jgi:hypothetical protein
MDEFWYSLFDHGNMWRQRSGSIVCTGQPYGNWKKITDSFRSMKEKFGYPDSIKMCPLGDRYRFRPNGDFMLLFYCDRANGCISILWNKGLRMSRGLLSGKASGTGRNIMQEGCINPGNCSRSWDIRL